MTEQEWLTSDRSSIEGVKSLKNDESNVANVLFGIFLFGVILLSALHTINAILMANKRPTRTSNVPSKQLRQDGKLKKWKVRLKKWKKALHHRRKN